MSEVSDPSSATRYDSSDDIPVMPLGLTYDSGAYAQTMQRALDRRTAARADGRRATARR